MATQRTEAQRKAIRRMWGFVDDDTYNERKAAAKAYVVAVNRATRNAKRNG